MTAYVPPIIEHSEWDDTPERVVLFAIERLNPLYGLPVEDGADAPEAMVATEYTMPAKAHVGLGLAFLRNIRLMGAEGAAGWLLEEAIGTAGFDALIAEPNVTMEQVKTIMTKVRLVVLGGLEAPKA